MLRPFKCKMDGGALYFALLVIVLLSVFSSGFILLNRLWFHENAIFTKVTQLHDNLDAAEILINENPALATPGKSMDIDIFNDSTVVRIETRRWGLLRLVELSAGWRSMKINQTSLYGGLNIDPIALYLADNNKFLSLVGKCIIKGDCFLPELGVRAGEIDGKSFQGSRLIAGKISTSRKELPELSGNLIESLAGYWDKQYSATDSIVSFSELIRYPVSRVSFNSPTTVIDCGENISLQNVNLSGNIIVTTSGTIEITPSARLEDIVLFAKNIIVDPNVNGTFQLFARERIIINDNCQMKYPSCAVCYSEAADPVQILIGKNCSISGGIIIGSHTDNPDSNSLIMGEESKLTGLIYVNGKVDFAGQIEGSLYCNSFFIDTPRAYYENYLDDAFIDPQTVPARFGSFVLDDSPEKLKMIKRCL